MDILTNNDLFRLFYCNIVSSDQCDEIGKYFGFLPAEFAWIAFLFSGIMVSFKLINGILGAVIFSIWAERIL